MYQESAQISNKGAGNYTFTLVLGGLYQLVAVGTWGGGSLTVNQLGPDGTTYLSTVTALTANGGATYYLPPGSYEFTIVTATGVSAALTRIPLQ